VCLPLNALKVGEDGMTPWMRARGRPFRQRLIGFAETVLYKLPLKGPRHDERGNMAPRWAQGVFMGYARDSNSYVISTDEGIRTSRALMRRPVENRWNIEAVAAVQCTPWSLRPTPEDPGVRLEPGLERHDAFPDAGPPLPRRFKILKDDLEEVG